MVDEGRSLRHFLVTSLAKGREANIERPLRPSRWGVAKGINPLTTVEGRACRLEIFVDCTPRRARGMKFRERSADRDR